MLDKIILASKSKVRKEILNKNNISVTVQPSTVDEDPIKKSLLKERASPEIISKNLAEIKACRVSQKNFDILVLGADSVIDLNGELISKPENRNEAMTILKKLNARTHHLVSSVCISRNGLIISESYTKTYYLFTGYKRLNNDAVNFFCTVSSPLFLIIINTIL